jgi:hypothetical protein
MVNRVTAEGLQVRQYFHRFTEDALDLCDVLGSYVPGVKVKLDEVTKILGLPGTRAPREQPLILGVRAHTGPKDRQNATACARCCRLCPEARGQGL